MKRSVGLLSIIAATVLAAPVAMAGDIVKCVDGGGHVTLTDQPCASGDAIVRLAQGNDNESAPAPQRYVLPAAELKRQAWKRPAAAAPAGVAIVPVAHPVRLSGDVATLKAAHRTLLLQDAKPRLAGLD